MLGRLCGGPLAETRPRAQANIDLRSEALGVLHRHQIALREQWRANADAGDEASSAALLDRLLLSVTAIAGGLRSTG